MKEILKITPESFAPFGTVLAFSENPPDPRFEVKVTEAVAPWRIAVFCVTIKKAHRLECHPDSLESFTPLSGTGVLLCAAPETPEEIHAFLLDTSVCLGKGVWHEVITLSEKSLYQITENLTVTSEFYDFAVPLSMSIAEAYL